MTDRKAEIAARYRGSRSSISPEIFIRFEAFEARIKEEKKKRERKPPFRPLFRDERLSIELLLTRVDN